MSDCQDVSPPARKRVLVVDDHEIVRRGWQFLISSETDLEVCGEAGTADQALELTEQLHPDVVVTCICLPGRTGLDLVKTLKTQHPHLPVLVVSTLDEKIFGERVLKAGGMGYLMKEAACEQLVIAVRQVLLGRYHVSEALSERFLAGAASGGTSKFPLERLTNREMQVFQLMGQGKSLEEIAEEQGIAVRTVEAHRTHMRSKLGLADSKELLRYAVRCFESGDYGN